jgi:hypothetical protein
MENFDPKTLIYFVIAILWLVFNAFKKAGKNQQGKQAIPPPLSEDEIKEIFNKPVAQKKKQKVLLTDKEPLLEHDFPRSSARVSNLKTEHVDISAEDPQETLPVFSFEETDLKKMVIFHEILKRPVH